MASNFPNTSVNNPSTNSPWEDGDTWNDPSSDLSYTWYNPVWKTGGTSSGGGGGASVEVGDTEPPSPVEGDLWWKTPNNVMYIYYVDTTSEQWVIASPPAKIATDPFTAQSVEVEGGIAFGGNNLSGGVEAEGGRLIDSGAIQIRRDTGTSEVFSVFSGGSTGSDKNVTITADGAATFAGGATFATGYTGVLDNGTIFANRSNGVDIVWSGATYGGQPTSTISAAGTGTFINSIITGKNMGGAQKIEIYSSIQYETNITATNYSGSGPASTAIVFGGLNAASAGYVEYARATPSGIVFNLESEDETKYTTTTDSEGVETRVYNGATLDIKDRLTKADTALQTLKTAAAASNDFAALKAAIATALADI